MNSLGGNSSRESKVLICIPAYNEARTISEIVKKAAAYGSQVIVYDDGSSDGTADVAKAAGATVIRNRINRGYGVAIRRLFEAAAEKNIDIMVTLDSDGQHDPNEIPQVIGPILNEGIDIVIGSRLSRSDKSQQRIPMYRNLGIKTISRFAQVASYSGLRDAQSGFRAYGKHALSKIELFEDGMSVSTEILVRAKEKNLTIKEVPVTVKYDVEDSSTHNPISHGVSVLYNVVQFISLKHPLSFYGLPGIALMIVAVIFANDAMRMFSATRYISTNFILLSVGTAVVGVVLLATGAILYTITALLKGRIKDF